MSTPHIIGAVDTIVETLEAITTAGGFNHDIETVSIEWNDEPSEAQRPHVAVIVDSKPHTFTFQPGNVIRVEHTLMIVARADVATDDGDTRLEVASQLEDDIIAALGGDLNLGQNVALQLATEGEYDVSRNNEGSSTSPYATARLEYTLTYFRNRDLTNGNGTTLMAHGQMSLDDAVFASAVIATPGTFVVLTPFSSTLGLAANFDRPTVSRLRYTGTRTASFAVFTNLGVLAPSGGNQERQFQIAVNGTRVGLPQPEAMPSGGGVEHVSIGWNVQLATDDYIEIHATSDGAETIQAETMNIRAIQIG